MPTEVTVSVYDYKQLMKEHDQNVKLIDQIKNEVSQECDNLGENAVPLYDQLALAN